MVNDWDYNKTWYHGSPLRLTVLSCGSTITQERNLARIFSHKPTLVSQDIDEYGQPIIKHTGVQAGFLYRIAEPIQSVDVYPHPETTMGVGQEWLTTRSMRVELIEPTSVAGNELLTAEEIAALCTKIAQSTS